MKEKEIKLTRAEKKKLQAGGCTDAEIDNWIKDPENKKWLVEEREKQKMIKKIKKDGIHIKF